jgi:hypothetical protein
VQAPGASLALNGTGKVAKPAVRQLLLAAAAAAAAEQQATQAEDAVGGRGRAIALRSKL